MNRHELLAALHEALAPRTYLEIGVRTGDSLVLSHARSIAVDPAFRLKTEYEGELQLVRSTSDDFFARPDPTAFFQGRPTDLALIDGLHLFEFAFRDFIGAEKHSSTTGVVVFDDMLPRTVSEAARDRHTVAWAGDVYKVTMVLEEYRPDLVVIPVDTSPTGVVVVAGLDPTNTVLTDKYDEIIAKHVYDDPQRVPDEYLHRTTSADPEKLVAASAWADLLASRQGSGERPASVDSLRELRGTASYVSNPDPEIPWPTKGTGAAKAANIRKSAVSKTAAKPASKPAKKSAKAVPKPPPSAGQRLRKAVRALQGR